MLSDKITSVIVLFLLNAESPIAVTEYPSRVSGTITDVSFPLYLVIVTVWLDLFTVYSKRGSVCKTTTFSSCASGFSSTFVNNFSAGSCTFSFSLSSSCRDCVSSPFSSTDFESSSTTSTGESLTTSLSSCMLDCATLSSISDETTSAPAIMDS